MKTTLKYVFALFLMLSISAQAHESLERQCVNERPINQTHSAVDAFVLMERIQYIGNTSDFTTPDWKAYVETLKAFKIGMGDLEVTVLKECWIHPEAAKTDKNLEPFAEKGFRSYQIIISGSSSLRVEDSGMVDKHHPNVYSDRFVHLEGIVITTGDCDNPINCGPRLLAFYVDQMYTTNLRLYAAKGGLSTAGGGQGNKNPMDSTFDYNNLLIVAPGFSELFTEQENSLPYRNQILNVGPKNPNGIYILRDPNKQ